MKESESDANTPHLPSFERFCLFLGIGVRQISYHHSFRNFIRGDTFNEALYGSRREDS